MIRSLFSTIGSCLCFGVFANAICPVSVQVGLAPFLESIFDGVVKASICQKPEKRVRIGKCLPEQRQSFVGHPNAI